MSQSEVSETEISEKLSRWFYVGEKIFWHGRPCRVLGFAEKYIPRGGFTHKLAGKYIDYSKVRVVTEDDRAEGICDIQMHIGGIKMKHYPDVTKILIKIGELPETPFWEGDIVEFKNPIQNNWVRVLDAIEYLDDGIRFLLAKKDCTTVQNAVWDSTKLTLVSRGNIWKLEHGEDLDFADIHEEAKFYQSLGMSQRIVHMEQTEFSLQRAAELLQMCVADQMKIKDRVKMTYVLIKYDKVEFGDHLRRQTLKQFGLGESGHGRPASLPKVLHHNVT